MTSENYFKRSEKNEAVAGLKTEYKPRDDVNREKSHLIPATE